ncbi:MAG: lysophospholipid acyltransferase family protein [Gemmatimonadaceae bacterium]|nr:lysophospholipid acyltransferase family protein [Gemmatimonadaceae bacterium]
MSQSDTPPRALDWKTRLAITLGGWLVRGLARTWRYRVVGNEALLARVPGTQPVVYTLWHGQMLPTLFAHRFRTGVLISEHKDGEIITRIVSLFGMFGVRGSSSRGGTRALLEAVRVVEQGADMAFTPDGPRGPRHSFAQGALILAHRAKVPVVFILAHTDQKWQLKSWDGFEIPKPFARITVLYTPPITLDDPDVRQAAARSDEFQARMMDALREVERLHHDPAGRPTS